MIRILFTKESVKVISFSKWWKINAFVYDKILKIIFLQMWTPQDICVKYSKILRFKPGDIRQRGWDEMSPTGSP